MTGTQGLSRAVFAVLLAAVCLGASGPASALTPQERFQAMIEARQKAIAELVERTRQRAAERIAAAQAQAEMIKRRAEEQAAAARARAEEIRRRALERANGGGNPSSPPTPEPPPPAPTPDTTAPSVPGSLSASAQSCTEITLSWEGSRDTGGSGLDAYEVYRDGVRLMVVNAPFTSAIDSGLRASTRYDYQVAAVDETGNRSLRSASRSVITPSCAPPPQEGAGLVLTGLLPAVGTAKAIALDRHRDLALVASDEFGLVVVDVADPATPTVLGSTSAFVGRSVAAAGSLAVVANNDETVEIVDVSDPSAPEVVGRFDGRAGELAFDGRYAFVMLAEGGQAELLVLDLARPDRPAGVARLPIPGVSKVRGLVLTGAQLYVALGTSGLQVVDVADPGRPRLRGRVDTPGNALGVAAAGNGFAYVADSSTIEVVDVRDPDRPRRVGSLATRANVVAIDGTDLYALANGTEIKALDVTSPTAPRLLSTRNARPSSIAAANGLLFLGGLDADLDPRLFVLEAGLLVEVGVTPQPFSASRVALADDLAVVSDGRSAVEIVDVSDPSAPEVVGRFDGRAGELAFDGRYAFVMLAEGGQAELLVLDLARPDRPSGVARLAIPGVSQARDLVLTGAQLYVALGTSGLQVVDVADPGRPRLRGRVDTPGNALGVAAAGNGFAYVADSSTIEVVDVRDPDRPRRVGSLATRANVVAIDGTDLYALANGNEIKVLDVASPTAPRLLGAHRVGAAAKIATIDGRVLFVGSIGGNGVELVLLDLGDPTRLEVVDRIVVPGTVGEIAVDGGMIAAADSAATIDLLELTPR